MTGKERLDYLKRKSDEYEELKRQWKTEYKACDGGDLRDELK